MVAAYAVYFDYKRRNDPQFIKQLKKESKRQARAAKEEAEANTVRQREAIRAAVEEAKEEGFPTDVEEREAYFMQEVARGEGLSGEGTSNYSLIEPKAYKSTGTDNVEAALCFYKALKVYPQPSDLITIYDKTGSLFSSLSKSTCWQSFEGAFFPIDNPWTCVCHILKGYGLILVLQYQSQFSTFSPK
jgi:hypothetical protein